MVQLRFHICNLREGQPRAYVVQALLVLLLAAADDADPHRLIVTRPVVVRVVAEDLNFNGVVLGLPACRRTSFTQITSIVLQLFC